MSEEEIEDKDINKIRRESRSIFFWGVGLFALLIILVGSTAWYIVSDPELSYISRFTYTMGLIGYNYPDHWDPDRMVQKAREAVQEELDRYSFYLEQREMTRVGEEFEGSYGGIGITISEHNLGLMIMTVRPDGPAAAAGLRTGDIILSADTVSLAGLDAYEATFVLRGPEGTRVGLKVFQHVSNDTLNLELIRQRLPLIHIPYAGVTENGSLYVRLLDFEYGATRDFFGAVDSLFELKKDSIRGLILDLRGNPGGLLDEALNTADLFLEQGKLIVGTRGRSRWVEEAHFATDGDIMEGKPIAILVDGNSASAAEIVSGSLKYAGRAILVGDTTFGKGLVQEYRGFDDGSGMRLTRSRYYFEGDRFINTPGAEKIDSGAGIPPDYYIASRDYEPFIRELENSFLLRQFAEINRDDLVQYAPFKDASPEWLARFKEFAAGNGFTYASEVSQLALLTRTLASFEGYSAASWQAIDRICTLARRQDSLRFDVCRDYIGRRLYELALESKFGLAESYRRAIVPYLPEVIEAERVMYQEK